MLVARVLLVLGVAVEVHALLVLLTVVLLPVLIVLLTVVLLPVLLVLPTVLLPAVQLVRVVAVVVHPNSEAQLVDQIAAASLDPADPTLLGLDNLRLAALVIFPPELSSPSPLVSLELELLNVLTSPDFYPADVLSGLA